MKRVLRFAAVNILGLALLAAGMPLQAAPNDQWHSSYAGRDQSGWSQRQQGDDRYRQDQRDDRSRQDQRDDRGFREDRRNYPGPRDGQQFYATAPSYYANGYAYPAGGYLYNDDHAGRTAAIIGGSAAAGALIGAAAGHGQGAAIGAVVGGIAGAIASQAARHNEYR
ncbi:MAG: hypothetical protein JO051_02085 [Acidobacteriaceae bacterium]|nr:hypothetical protein [Acidobacteriaceae bacterium]